MNTNNTAGTLATTPLSRHRSVWEVRTESWIELVDELSQLANPARDDRAISKRAWRTCTN
jgi:hypothetical protein